MTPTLIAEVGCNHKGDLSIAMKMIRIAAEFCGVDVVKFQKRNPKESLSAEQYNRPHPDPSCSYGDTYGEHRNSLELNLDEHRKLKECCEKHGVTYSSSVWDRTSAREIISLEPDMIKIPSACNMNKPLLEIIAKDFLGEIHISMGMTTPQEQLDIVDFFIGQKRTEDLVIYNCVSGYPVPFEDICLLDLSAMKCRFTGFPLGFSGHHLGIAVDVAAITLGAEFVERHFTLDRTWKGTDHAASLEPDGLRKLSRDIRNVSQALTFKPGKILPIEKIQREKLKEHQIKWTP